MAVIAGVFYSSSTPSFRLFIIWVHEGYRFLYANFISCHFTELFYGLNLFYSYSFGVFQVYYYVVFKTILMSSTYLTELTKISWTMVNSSGDCRHLCMFLIFMKMSS